MEKKDLKFRVWNGSEMEHDIMVGKFGIFYVNPSNNGIDENDNASLSPFNTKYPDDIPLMRFTGLYDKNGKEIWEGDILAFERIKDFKKEYVFPKEIKWENRGDRGVTGWTQFAPMDKVVVIGNIYENPEILNGLEEAEAGGRN